MRIRLAEAHLARGDTAAGIEAVETAINIDKKNGNAFLVLGLAQEQAGNSNEALKAFLKSIELRESGEFAGLDDTLAQAHFYAGVVYFRQKNLDESIVHLKSAVRIKRANSLTHLYLGKAYAAKQWYGKAMQEYDIATQLDPLLAEAQFELGRLFERQKDTVRAIEHYRKAQEAMPNRPEPKEALARFGTQDGRYAQGQTYLRDKQYQKAVKELRIALAFDPKFVNAHYALGEAYEKTRQKKKAIAAYKQALRYDPDLKDAKAALKRLTGK